MADFFNDSSDVLNATLCSEDSPLCTNFFKSVSSPVLSARSPSPAINTPALLHDADENSNFNANNCTDYSLHASSLFSVDLSSPKPQSSLSPAHETDEERRIREEEESMRMAIALMEQEAMEYEARQREFMLDAENVNDLSPEDLAAIREIVGGQATVHRFDTSANDADSVEETNESDDHNEDSDRWDYDQLLALGQALGDVKTERWQARASRIINSLPTVVHRHITQEMNLKSEPRCVVCLDAYEDDQVLTILPCKHYFHDICASGWLAGHYNCPVCKSELSMASPDKKA